MGGAIPRDRRLGWLWQSFPVTSLMLAQLVALYVLPPYLPGATEVDASSGLVVRVFSLVLLGTLSAESIASAVRYRTKSTPPQNPPWGQATELPVSRERCSAIALTLSVLAFAGLILSAAMGRGAYVASGEFRGPVATLATLLSVLQIPAVATAMLSRKKGGTAAALMTSLGLCAVGNLAVSLRGGMLINLADFFFLVLALALTLSAISWRALLVGALIAGLCWPALFQLRNERRYELARQEVQITLVDRIRQDSLLLQMNRAVEPSLLDIPSDLEMLRYVVPRPLDPGRPNTAVGPQISYAVSGSFTNSNTLSQPGNIYYLRGGPYLFSFYFLVALLFSWLLPRQNDLYALTTMSAMIANLIWVGPPYPSTIGGFLQAAAYGSLAIFALSKFLSRSENATSSDSSRVTGLAGQGVRRLPRR